MLINNINITTYNAELIDRNIIPINIASQVVWNTDANNGIVLSQDKNWKTISITLLIKYDSESEAFININNISEQLKECVIKFDDIELLYRCVIQGEPEVKRVANGQFKVSYSLLNDIAKASAATNIKYTITPVSAIEITIDYYDNRETTMGHYNICFDDNDKYLFLGTKKYYIDATVLPTKAAAADNWTTYFLSLGIDINKYKPSINNTYNGELQIATPYSVLNAVSLFDDLKSFKIYYNRFHKDGIPDYPDSVYYPNQIVGTSGSTNGVAWYYKIPIPTEYQNTAKLGYKIYISPYGSDLSGTQTLFLGGGFKIHHTNADGYSGITPTNIDVVKPFEDGVNCFVNPTIKEYSKNLTGYQDSVGIYSTIFNGKVVGNYTIIEDDSSTTTQLLIFSDENVAYYGSMILSKVEIYYDNNLIASYVPVGAHTNIANCFYNNNYGNGLYDTINMNWISAWNSQGGYNPKPSTFMNWPT